MNDISKKFSIAREALEQCIRYISRSNFPNTPQYANRVLEQAESALEALIEKPQEQAGSMTETTNEQPPALQALSDDDLWHIAVEVTELCGGSLFNVSQRECVTNIRASFMNPDAGRAFKAPAQTAAQPVDERELPPLPHTTYNGYSDGSEPLYTAEQMTDYARAALSQSIAAAPQFAIPDGYVLMPKKLTAENGAKDALSGEFAETVDLTCPECAEAGEVCEGCEVCGGDGSVRQHVPVEWSTIKSIYKKAVEVCAAPITAVPILNNPVEVDFVKKEVIDQIILAVSELPDDDRHQDQHGVMMVTADELRGILEDQIVPAAAPAQEPVAWMRTYRTYSENSPDGDEGYLVTDFITQKYKANVKPSDIPLYAAPASAAPDRPSKNEDANG